MVQSSRRGQTPFEDPLSAPLVSIIIPSKNSEQTIAECIRSIRSQSYKPIEVIVVDAFSADSTREIAKRIGARILTHLGERSSARNLGAKCANGEYLYFVDADHELGPDAVAACIMAIETSDGVLIRDQDKIRDSRISRLVASRRRMLSYDPLNVAVRFVRNDVFHRLGGFDTDLYAGEDLDFHRRFLLHGFKMAYSEAQEWHLGSPVDLKGLLNRALYYSPNYVAYAAKNPLISIRRLNPLRVVKAWKKSDGRSPDLLLVLFLGLLSDIFLGTGVLINLGIQQFGKKVE